MRNQIAAHAQEGVKCPLIGRLGHYLSPAWLGEGLSFFLVGGGIIGILG